MNSQLFSLADDHYWEKIQILHQHKGGVYKLISIQDGQPRAINRFLGTDREGVLYIGKADAFLDRIPNLKKSIAPGYRGASHGCGVSYKSNPRIADQFPYESLHVVLMASENPRALEATLLQEYRKIFGEVPPLNSVC